MTVDLNELNFLPYFSEKIRQDRELDIITKDVQRSNLLTIDQAKQLTDALVLLPSFQVDYSHEVLRDLQTAGILNAKNIDTFFSLLPQSAFLSHMALILTVKKVMSPTEQAQRNFDLLSEYARTRLKGTDKHIEERKRNIENVFNLVINIQMSAEQFQETFQIIMKFAQAPELIKKMAVQLAEIYQQNFANYLRDQQHMTELSIKHKTRDVFSKQFVMGSPRKLKNYSGWEKTKALTFDDLTSVIQSINDSIQKQKIAFLGGIRKDSEIKKFNDSEICDFNHLTRLIFDFFTPELKTKKKQLSSTEPPPSDPKAYSPSPK